MKQAFITDTHLMAPNAVPASFFGDEILLGDIIDLANCSNKQVPEGETAREKLKDRYKDKYLDGNHERYLPIGTYYIFKSEKNGSVFCTHGDNESNRSRWIDYRQKPHGASIFKRVFVVHAIEIAEKLLSRDMGKDFLDAAAAVAKAKGCSTYVCGHFHPKAIIDQVHNGIRIIVLPRGKTILDL